MVVAYQSDLGALARELGTMGFEMHPLGDEVAAEAVLFTSQPARALAQAPARRGALLLNVRGMNAAQAAQALRRRAAGPIL